MDRGEETAIENVIENGTGTEDGGGGRYRYRDRAAPREAGTQLRSFQALAKP